MSLEGTRQAAAVLSAGGSAGDAVEKAVMCVESNPDFLSVGYGGLPAKDGHVRLDAGWMDGDSLRCGAVMSAETILNPIRAARLLSSRHTNWMLAGRGADEFAREAGLPTGPLLTPRAKSKWEEAIKAQAPGEPEAYKGHDTVCFLGLDDRGSMVAGTSTSGLFMKELGRVGDTPVPGSGFYCDSRIGACAATGLGEDIMRGVLSFDTVSRMASGLGPQEACTQALRDYLARLSSHGDACDSISLICLAPDGRFGAATTQARFPLTVMHSGLTAPAVWGASAGQSLLYAAAPEDFAGID